MPIIKEAANHVRLLFGSIEGDEILRLAKKADALEKEWEKRAEELNEEMLYLALVAIEDGTGTFEMESLLTAFFMDHMVEVTSKGVDSSRKRRPTVPKKSQLAVSSKGLKKWMAIWDAWRTKGTPTKAIKKRAQGVMKEYLKATKSWYTQASEPLRRGEIPKKDIAKVLAKQIKTPLNRAKTIVNTETTNYWNESREVFYSANPDVTHYLFMSIRDFRTTKWCKTRHGLVYEKDDPLFEKEKPACHWNCRSEILPLTPLSPRHQTLIQDKTKARRNNSPEPLPKGWKR